MKFQHLLKAMLVIVFSIILVSCAKTEKEKIINFNNDVVEWFTNKDFTKEMKSQVKAPEQMNKFMSDNIARIAKENGFKDEKETEKAFQKLMNDKDIKKLLAETEIKVKSRMAEMQQYQMELVQKFHPEMLQQAPPQEMPQDAPAPAVK